MIMGRSFILLLYTFYFIFCLHIHLIGELILEGGSGVYIYHTLQRDYIIIIFFVASSLVAIQLISNQRKL